MKYIALLILCFLGFAHADLPTISDCTYEASGSLFHPTDDQVLNGEEAGRYLSDIDGNLYTATTTQTPWGLFRYTTNLGTVMYYYRNVDVFQNYYYGVWKRTKCGGSTYNCVLKDLTKADCFGCKTPAAKNYAPEYVFHNESSCEYGSDIENMPCLEVKHAYLENCNDCNAID